MANVVTKYDTHVKPRFSEIYKWVREGMTDVDMAKKLGIHEWTLRDYKKKHEELAKVLERPTYWELKVQPRLVDIKQWCEEGATNSEIAARLGISEGLWYEYINKYPILNEFVSLGRSVTNAEVEKSLYKLCTGYEYEEIKTVIEEAPNGKKKTRIEKTKKYVPPSSQAIQFYLKNRMPEQWNDKKEFIFDTKENEEARKKLFLEMIDDDLIEADYSEVEDNLIEVPEEAQKSAD